MGQTERDWRKQPRVTRDALASDLRQLGLGAGAAVLVHSSLSRLGHVVGGAETVIDALLDTVGPAGTLLFPTLTASPHDVPSRPPSMDVRATPCWTGRIPETARRRPEALRSLHPTHSVAAIGAARELYTADHERGTSPCDEHSPYYRLIAEGGHILLLGGVTQQSNTTLHCLEELAAVPYHLQPEVTDCTVIDAAGRVHRIRNRLHMWRRLPGFEKVEGPLGAAGALRMGRVGQASARLMPAGVLAEVLLPLLRENPLYLLSDEGRQEFEEDFGTG